jgi:hypothetical protein
LLVVGFRFGIFRAGGAFGFGAVARNTASRDLRQRRQLLGIRVHRLDVIS